MIPTKLKCLKASMWLQKLYFMMLFDYDFFLMPNLSFQITWKQLASFHYCSVSCKAKFWFGDFNYNWATELGRVNNISNDKMCIRKTNGTKNKQQGMHVFEQKAYNIYCLLLNRLLRDRTQQTYPHLQISHIVQLIF